jgi:hypothetical protein
VPTPTPITGKFSLKAFASNAIFTNNTPGIIAGIGEISPQSLTYARERGLYADAIIAPGISVISFLSAMNGVKQRMAKNVSEHVLDVVKFVYTKILNTAGTLYIDQLTNDAITAFGSICTNFEFGEIVSNGDGNTAPAWISWKNIGMIGSEFTTSEFKVWFVDDSFRREFDEFEITVIPPVDNLDLFFRTGADVELMIKAITPSATMDRVQLKKNAFPDSIVRAESFNYIDPLNTAHKVSTTWHLLIYGEAGNNIDSITDAIIDFVLANSTHSRDDWITIMPDLFKRTEFTLMPLWEEYAIPNRTLEAGIHSPLVNLLEKMPVLLELCKNYPSNHIGSYTNVMSNPYKSLQILTIGSPENRNDWFQLKQVMADYIDVSSTSIDFNRMSLKTQLWATMIAEMIIVAESVTEFKNVPNGMSKTKRNGRLFVVKRYDNINYLIAAKVNFPLTQPIPPVEELPPH